MKHQVRELLINKTDLQKFRQVSDGLKKDRIDNFIKSAQFKSLKPLLGDAFYYDVIKNRNEDDYQNLIYGCEFTHCEAELQHFGLRAVLSLYTLAEYYLFGNSVDTPFSFVNKTNDFSQPVSNTQLRDMSKSAKQEAWEYWRDVEKYLCVNTETFSLWKNSCCQKVGVPRRRHHIDKL